MSICDHCTRWLCHLFAHRERTPLDVLSMYRTHYVRSAKQFNLEFDHVAEARQFCWFCARIWGLVQLTGKGSSHQGKLLSDDEVYDMIRNECHCSHKHIHIMASFFVYGPYRDCEVMRVTYHMNDPSKQFPTPPFFELDLVLDDIDYNLDEFRGRYFSNPSIYRAEKMLVESEELVQGVTELASQVTSIVDEKTGSNGSKGPESFAYRLSQMHSGEPVPNTELRNTESFFPLERVAQIKSWIAECDTQHDCAHLGSFVPSRLIHIGDDGMLRLIETPRPVPENMKKYATLSHCWGERRFDVLTKSGLLDAQQELRFSPASKTFREAIELCRRLSIDYIWIDSWCIIQDDVEDWLREAPQMHHVYGSSHLNIAAAASKSCDEGLVRPLAHPLVRGIVIELPDRLKIHGGLHGGMLGYDSALIRLLFEASPLFLRGWAVQEMYLSPRVLYVTDVQLYFKCQDKFWHEKPPINVPPGDMWSYTYWNQLRKGLQADLVTHRWHQVAKNFSHTSLSVQSDRSMALSGVATRVRETYAFCGVETKFVAGCWEHEMLTWLMWIVSGPPTDFRTREQYPHQPSWSWLSHPGHASFMMGLKTLKSAAVEPFLKVKHINTALMSPDMEFGPLVTAELTICGPRLFIQNNKDVVKTDFLDALTVTYESRTGWGNNLAQIRNDRGDTLHTVIGHSNNTGGYEVSLMVRLELDYSEEVAEEGPAAAAASGEAPTESGRQNSWPDQFECILVASRGSIEEEGEEEEELKELKELKEDKQEQKEQQEEKPEKQEEKKQEKPNISRWWFIMIVEPVPDSDKYRRIGVFLVEYVSIGGDDKTVLPTLREFFGRKGQEQPVREYVLV